MSVLPRLNQYSSSRSADTAATAWSSEMRGPGMEKKESGKGRSANRTRPARRKLHQFGVAIISRRKWHNLRYGHFAIANQNLFASTYFSKTTA